ncbi:MAG TPA: DUF748 domain-containing protein [Agitococcus sp.]|nr:DUF748 domain-containing protein [Moraxellaceae bacterium]HQV79991.1 DUF748 domain-containing protein [Agitococcus sp.]
MSNAITPQINNKNKKRLLGLGSLLSVYSLLGFVLAPVMVTKVAKDYVHEQLYLDLSLENVEINPLTIAVKLQGLAIKTAEGEILVSARDVYLNASLLRSIWQQAVYVEELDIIKPYINANINKNGQLNLLKLIPPDDNKEPSHITWQLAVLGIHQAQVDFVDNSLKQPFNAQIKNINVQLASISSLNSHQGNYQFAAQTAQHEKLSWQGTIALNPVRSQGHFSIEALQLTTPTDYMAEALPVKIKQGTVNVAANYQLQITNEQPQFSISQGKMSLLDVSAQMKNNSSIEYLLPKVELTQLNIAWPEAQASFDNLLLQQPQIKDIKNNYIIAMLESINLNQAKWQQKNNNLSLHEFSAQQFSLNTPSAPLLVLPQLNVSQFIMDDSQLNTGRIVLTGGQTAFNLFKTGQNNWQQEIKKLIAQLIPVTHDKPKIEASKTPIKYHLGELLIKDFVVNAQDNQQTPVFKQKITINSVQIHPELDLQKPHQLTADLVLQTGGKLQLSGSLQEAPLTIDAKLNLTKLNLPPLASYLKDVALLSLESGQLAVDGDLHFQQQPKLQATFNGKVGINDFALNDLKLNERFLAWKRLLALGIKWQLEPMSLYVKEINTEQPFGRVIIAPDKSINLAQVLVADSKKASAAKKSTPMTLKIDKTIVSNGSMLFADLSITPQFATGIQALNGSIIGISSAANSDAKIDLKGQVDQYGKAIILGELNPFSPDKNTNMSVKFDNIELTTLTPYSSKFAGYRIDKGKLNLDLNYKIANRELIATNKVVLNQLTLGERVDSPDAKNLPIRLAIALLKDSNGLIDLDIPITGSLDDPQFKVAPIVWQAIVNVITKAATAPFKFIANLVGGGEDMDSIAFKPTQVTLQQEQSEKLVKMAQALQKRPELNIEIRGAFNSQQESLLLKEDKFKQALQVAMVKMGTELRAVEFLYKQQFGLERFKQQQVLQFKPSTDSTKSVLQTEPLAYQQALKQQLIDAQPKVEGELRQLALERAKNIRNELVENQHIADGRIFILEPVDSVSTSTDAVISKISIKQP